MNDDIVDRLRDYPDIWCNCGLLKREAADEIEKRDAEIERLRTVVRKAYYGPAEDIDETLRRELNR